MKKIKQIYDEKNSKKKKRKTFKVDPEKLTDEEKKLYYRELERASIPPQELYVADCLSKFIKYNPNLHHLDVQCCGLTKHILKEIAIALRKSRSLIGIHLSENPGLSAEIKEFIRERVHCKPSDFEENNMIDLRRYDNLFKK